MKNTLKYKTKKWEGYFLPVIQATKMEKGKRKLKNYRSKKG